jgi:palmitoyltransferase
MLILSSQTTVESMMIRNMKERESKQLDKAFACWDIRHVSACVVHHLNTNYECRSKRYSRKEWDREWGDLDTEGHIWWMEDRRAAWEDVMGTNAWGWFCESVHDTSLVTLITDLASNSPSFSWFE